MYRAPKDAFSPRPRIQASEGPRLPYRYHRCEGRRGRRGHGPWRRFRRIDVKHGRSVLDGRITPGMGSNRVTNAWIGLADCGGVGYRNRHSQRPIPSPSLTKQGGAEPSGSLSLFIVAFEMRETGNGRKPQSSEGGGLDEATSEWTRSFNHQRA
jgi:hypothetical protein